MKRINELADLVLTLIQIGDGLLQLFSHLAGLMPACGL